MIQEKKQERVQPKKIEESLSYTVEVRDKDGRVIQRISAPSRSYVEQWNQLINVHVGYPAAVTVKDTGGTDRSVTSGPYTLQCNAPISYLLYGILVGKGATAVAIDDYALETPLEEGTGTDEFNHQAVNFTEPSVVGSTCSFTVKRIMINNSGATITGIREIGCYIKGETWYFLGFRDVLPSAVDVPDGGAVTVEYTIGVTV